MLYYIELTLIYHVFPFHKDKFTKNFPCKKERIDNFKESVSKTKRARQNLGKLVDIFYIKAIFFFNLFFTTCFAIQI